MLVKDLDGSLLDYCVARAEGYDVFSDNSWGYEKNWIRIGISGSVRACPKYSTNWADGGPLIEKYKLEVVPIRRKAWSAFHSVSCSRGWGETPMQAICRAVVVSKYGEEVPDEIESTTINKGKI